MNRNQKLMQKVLWKRVKKELKQRMEQLLRMNINDKNLTKATLQIPNSHYKKKQLKTGKNLLALSKGLLVTITRT